MDNLKPLLVNICPSLILEGCLAFIRKCMETTEEPTEGALRDHFIARDQDPNSIAAHYSHLLMFPLSSFSLVRLMI